MIRRIMTGSRNRRSIGLVGLFVFIGIMAGGLSAVTRSSAKVPLTLGDRQYTVRVVSSPDEREKGLSGTAPLATDEGMLFVFDQDGQWGIWMKDMNYPIDILWLDQAKTVVDMVENASPASYPDTTFKPKMPARYVLELAAGRIADSSVAIGSRATFSVKASGGGK